MRALFLCLILLLPAPLFAQTGPTVPKITRLTDPSEPCPIALPGWATAPERYAWDQICRGQIADMRRFDPNDTAGCNALSDAHWPETRTLSPRFVRLVTSRAPYTDVPRGQKVSIRCAVLTGPVDLSEEHIPQSFALRNSRLPYGASLYNAEIDGRVSLTGSAVDRAFLWSSATVAGDVFLRGGRFPAMEATGAKVLGSIDADRATFSGLFTAAGMTVDLGLFIRGTTFSKGVNLLQARVGGPVSAIGATVTGLLNADGLTVSGALFFREAEFLGEVRLVRAQVGENFEADDAAFTGPLRADRLSVGGGMFLRNGARFEDMDLIGADIGGSVQLQGGRFGGKVDLTDMVGGALALSLLERHVTWGEGARLILRNAQVGTLQMDPGAVLTREDGAPLHIDPVGFRYDRMGGFGAGDGYDLAAIDAALIDTLVQSPLIRSDDPSTFVPQPYMQFERVLRETGADRAADTVALARHEARKEWLWHEGNCPASAFNAHRVFYEFCVSWIGEAIWGTLTGYGVRPFRVLWWYAGLVMLGTFLAARADRVARRGWSACFWYSVENATPLMNPSTDHEGVRHDTWWIDWFFHFQKFAGFVLATILVGALTLLGG